MTKRTATPVRFDGDVADRLARFVGSRPGLSLSAAANQLVDEGLRMSEHPGIAFREGPTGRRAALTAGPDVWEIIRAVISARSAEPDLDDETLLALVARNSGVPERLIRIALRYWTAYAAEIDREIDAAEHAESVAEQAARRQHRLLGAAPR